MVWRIFVRLYLLSLIWILTTSSLSIAIRHLPCILVPGTYAYTTRRGLMMTLWPVSKQGTPLRAVRTARVRRDMLVSTAATLVIIRCLRVNLLLSLARHYKQVDGLLSLLCVLVSRSYGKRYRVNENSSFRNQPVPGSEPLRKCLSLSRTAYLRFESLTNLTSIQTGRETITIALKKRDFPTSYTLHSQLSALGSRLVDTSSSNHDTLFI